MNKKLDFLTIFYYHACMTSEEIKMWLRSTGHNRAWLAERVGVAAQTVNGWLSSGKNIPSRRRAQIEALMGAADASAPAPHSVLVLNIPADEFDKWNAAAMAQGLLIREWAERVLAQATGPGSLE